LAEITTRGERRAKFLHACQDVLIHPGSEASARMVWLYGVQTDLAHALVGIDGEQHKADDLLPDRDR
jgi:hypothetical protein